MASAAEGPTYISSRSADVILSDIRPTKFNIEALRSINVLLDELLYSVLNAARSLTPHQLRAGLLKVLPTTLGKEALLEAEMELRAYLERTGVSAASLEGEEQGKDFNLQWSFELLRLKCQAYSTLGDSDEDPQAEARLIDRFGKSVNDATPPKATLVAPAALYLTAILESVCEHVLSNVGRVATRDSSRATATVQDLFVALCEDDSIYGLFKTMKVYEKIENLSKGPKPRRSKSFSRPADIHSPACTSSPQQGQTTLSLNQSASLPSRSRPSESDSAASMATAVASAHASSNSRSSFDKARAIKMFSNSRASESNSSANDGSRSHKRSDSILSDGMKRTITAFNGGSDAASFGTTSLDDQEFDNMMRSDSTMKVSLTPDRLKSMEVYNKEKSQKGSRKAVQKSNSKGSLRSREKSSKSSPPNLLKRVNSRQLSFAEDEEYKALNGGRSRQASSQKNTSTPPVSAASARLRSVSVTSPPPIEKDSHANQRNLPINSPSFTPSSPPSTHNRGMSSQQSSPGNGFPARTRKIQRNRESLDLDDIIGGNNDEDEVVVDPPKSAPRSLARGPGQYPVSAGARDLIEFLAEGPPIDPSPEPADSSMPLDTPSKAKGGRLQRMISKLTLKDDDRKFRGGDSYPKLRRTGSTAGQSPPLQSPPILAPKPVPPRPPPISPPSPPSSPSQHSLVEPTLPARPRRQSTPRKPTAVGPTTPQTTPKPLPDPSPVLPPKEFKQPPRVSPSPSQNKDEDGRGSSGSRTTTKQLNGTTAGVLKSPPERHSSKMNGDAKPQPTAAERSVLVAISDNARDMHRLLAHATNAEECRLIVDLFLAKSNLPPNAEATEVGYPSPPSDNNHPLPSAAAATNLENNLVELFLGGVGEEEVEGDEELLSPLSPNATNPSKDATPVTLPVSPPDTPLPSHLNVSAAILQKVSRDTLPVNLTKVATA